MSFVLIGLRNPHHKKERVDNVGTTLHAAENVDSLQTAASAKKMDQKKKEMGVDVPASAFKGWFRPKTLLDVTSCSHRLSSIQTFNLILSCWHVENETNSQRSACLSFVLISGITVIFRVKLFNSQEHVFSLVHRRRLFWCMDYGQR